VKKLLTVVVVSIIAILFLCNIVMAQNPCEEIGPDCRLIVAKLY